MLAAQSSSLLRRHAETRGYGSGSSSSTGGVASRGARGSRAVSAPAKCAQVFCASFSSVRSADAHIHTREIFYEEPVVLLQETAPEPLSIDLTAAAQLLPDGRSISRKHQHINLSSKDRFVLAYEVDGTMQPRHSLVTLRVDPPNERVQVHGALAMDTLQGRRLAGWRREANGRLVAVLQSLECADDAGGAHSSGMQAAVAALGQPAGPTTLPASPAPVSHHQAHSPAPLPPHLDVNPGAAASDPHHPLLQAAQHQMQQHLAFSAAGAAAVLSAAQHAMHLPVRTRTFTPSRVRPISEVYVPFRLWRELFDGSMKTVPPSGIPLQIVVTGAVQLQQQEVMLVRQITRYGYFVLKGINGLSRLRGKLLVRWSLLVSGVVEMEVVDEPLPTDGDEDGDLVVPAGKATGRR